VQTLVVIGPKLNDLLAILNPHSRWVVRPNIFEQDFEKNLDRYFENLKWGGYTKKIVRFDYEINESWLMPRTIQVIPSNQWSSVFFRVAECLGLRGWKWQVSYLRSQIDDLIPRVATRSDLSAYSVKVAKWLRALTPNERTAWNDLQGLVKAVSDDEIEFELSRFVSMLTTTIYQNHYQALHSLQIMRAPAVILWAMENWIVSSKYSKLRLDLGTNARVPVPSTLQRLPSICESSNS
jgi:hypothetical protein